MASELPAARGRHAPPPEVRLPLQRERLFRAAPAEFAARGYTGASSESISRCAGMSKATFYEHFANKEECIIALFDRAAGVVASGMGVAARGTGDNPLARMHAGTRAFLTSLADYPDYAQTLLVEIIGAGPRAALRRDQVMQQFADLLDAENERGAKHDMIPRFASRHDAFAVIGAITELVSRQVRLGEPADLLELAPVIDRLIVGMLQGP